jgi:hypothetical protein
LPQLSVAWAPVHSTITPVIVGPSDLKQMTTLIPTAVPNHDPAALDSIDQIIEPGTGQQQRAGREDRCPAEQVVLSTRHSLQTCRVWS